MAADLHLHVFDDKFTPEHYKMFQSNVIGSKYFEPNPMGRGKRDYVNEEGKDLFTLCAETNQVWIGEVSWLKAAIFENEGRYVPGPVIGVSELIDEDFPILTEKLKSEILGCFDIDNMSTYQVAHKQEVEDFLNRNMGKQLFTISW